MRQWAERVDGALGDVFASQDEIKQSIIRIVVAHVGTRGTPSLKSWTAHDLMMHGDQAQRMLELSWSPKHLYEARRLFAEVQKKMHGCAKLGHTYVRAYADPLLE